MIELEPISKAEAGRYMGVRELAADSAAAALLEKYEPVVRSTLRPAYVYRETAVDFLPGGVQLEGMAELLTGEDILRHLEGCSRCVVLAATVSTAADRLIRQTAVTDTAGAFAVDCLCSAAIEQVCRKAEEEIFANIQGNFRTWRFSPGYGDLPLELQGAFLRFVNAQRRIGLTVSESCMLNPTKSVTAVIGICEAEPEHRARGCDVCALRDRCGHNICNGNTAQT